MRGEAVPFQRTDLLASHRIGRTSVAATDLSRIAKLELVLSPLLVHGVNTTAWAREWKPLAAVDNYKRMPATEHLGQGLRFGVSGVPARAAPAEETRER